MKIYSINQFSKLIGKAPQTLRNWDLKGTLKPYCVGSNGYRYYSEEQLNEVLKKLSKKKITIGYCSVFSGEQEKELDEQVRYLKTHLTKQGKPFEIITDIGECMYNQRTGVKELVQNISKGRVDKIVILAKNEAMREGIELIKCIAELKDCEIEVLSYDKRIERINETYSGAMNLEDYKGDFDCRYEVAFCPKYARKLLVGPIAEKVEEIFKETATQYGFKILDLIIRPNYCSLIISCDPTFGIMECVTKLKMCSARVVKKEFPEVMKKVPNIWTRKTFVRTLGKSSLYDMNLFIGMQKKN